MGDTHTESSLDDESNDGLEPEQLDIVTDDEVDVEIHESKEDILRRKKIKRLLERELERKRLREELDDFVDFDEENIEDDDTLDFDEDDSPYK